ncbi:aldo/keto reductase family protein [Ceratobasidium sp. AG-Ba]|nr:aldo/keto reductase family protein [Ceratobasidium sp. AG-Ba]
MSNLSLPTRKIGNDNVTAIGFGAMGIGGVGYWNSEAGKTGDDESRFKVLDKLLELGCTNWDTANIYGDSENLIGKWFKRTGKRDQVGKVTWFIVNQHTQFGITQNGPRGDPEYVKECIDRSLERLGVDVIDLYYVHRVDSNVPIEITMNALADLVRQVHPGKIRYIGLSAPSPATLRRAHKIHPIAAIQVEYSAFVTEIEAEGHLLDTARELGIAIVAYSPIGKSLLNGRIKTRSDLPEGDLRLSIPKYSEENFPKIMALVAKLHEIGKAHNASATQVALAFLLAQGDDVIPIPGTKNVDYVEENLAAAHVNLTLDELQAIRKAIKETEVSGDRYPPMFMKMMYRDTPELSG